MTEIYPPTRKQFEEFLKNHELIRRFELLFRIVGEDLFDLINQSSDQAQSTAILLQIRWAECQRCFLWTYQLQQNATVCTRKPPKMQCKPRVPTLNQRVIGSSPMRLTQYVVIEGCSGERPSCIFCSYVAVQQSPTNAPSWPVSL